MARKYLVSLDLSNLETLNLRFQNLVTDPTSGVGAGSVYFNTVAKKVKYHNGTNFYDPTDRANHTGTQLASSISDFSTAAALLRIDQLAVPTVSLNLNNQKITNLAPGVAGTDAVNYNQLQAIANGTDWKASVRAATTVTLAALSGLLTIDGITLAAGDRVLVKDQSAAAANGIYVVASGAWNRASDAGAGQLTSASTVMVEEGVTLASTQWRITTTGTITVGTTALAWGQIGAGTSYTGGRGVTVNGNVINSTGPQKYAETIGGSTTITVTHNLGNKDLAYSIRQVSDDSIVDCDVSFSSANTAVFAFAVAPTAASLRVVLVG